MHIRCTTLTIPGAPLEGESPLPMLRSPDRDKTVPPGDLTSEQLQGLGCNTGGRWLPYRIQNRYHRAQGPMELKLLVLENEYLRASFLPEYGGRLYSLVQKELGRELLFCNSVFQPGNLAIRGAWFSGGIEWNFGQTGHAFTTCSPLFCAEAEGIDGAPALRMFEYERCHGLFWQMDFVLPPGSRTLYLHVRLVNDNSEPKPLYWWTNTAVPERPGTRVFASAGNVLCQNAEGGFVRGTMPFLPILPDRDASYPAHFPFASEYFFQPAPETRAPWEAALDLDENWMFWERSTLPLRYRKLFCWGMHPGGRRWKEFLSVPGQGNYIEIQAGLAPTQLHGRTIPGNTELEFLQCFGGAALIPDEGRGAWAEERDALAARIDLLAPQEELERVRAALGRSARKQPVRFLHFGTGFGALEQKRREREGGVLPAGLVFPEESLGPGTADWQTLLERGVLPEMEPDRFPASYFPGGPWKRLLEQSRRTSEGDTAHAAFQLGLMAWEDGEPERAERLLERSLQIRPNLPACRTLGYILGRRREFGRAVSRYQQGIELAGGRLCGELAAEYLELLAQAGRFTEAWDWVRAQPPDIREAEPVRIAAAKIALELEQFDGFPAFFAGEFAAIREGDTVLSDLWLGWHARLLAGKTENRSDPALLERAEREFPVPWEIDFRVK